jgi:hypothetical protein
MITKTDQGHQCLREENINMITKTDQGHQYLREENLNRITKTDQGHQCLREENLNRPRSPMPEGGEPKQTKVTNA